MSTPTTNRRVLLDSGKPERHATTPSKTPGRRVFGELATNAKVSPQKPAITSIKPQAPPSPSPRKQSRALPLPKNENASSEALRQERMTARKRSIHEVEDAVVREDAPGFPAKRVAGRADLSKSSRPPIHVRPDTTATAPVCAAFYLVWRYANGVCRQCPPSTSTAHLQWRGRPSPHLKTPKRPRAPLHLFRH